MVVPLKVVVCAAWRDRPGGILSLYPDQKSLVTASVAQSRQTGSPQAGEGETCDTVRPETIA